MARKSDVAATATEGTAAADANADAYELRDRPALPRSLAYRIAGEADVDVRSVFKRIEGEPVRGRAGERIIESFERHGVRYPTVLMVDDARSYTLAPGFSVVQVRHKPKPASSVGAHAPGCPTANAGPTVEDPVSGAIVCRTCNAVLTRREDREDLPAHRRGR